MGTGSNNRANAARPISTGAGGGAGGLGWPGRVSAAPPEIPGLGGDESPPRSVMGLLRRNPSFAPQEYASAASAAYAASATSNTSAASNASNASSARRLLLPSGEVIDVPEGLCAKVDKRGNVVYRVEGREVVVRLVGELLFRVSRGYRGSVACLDDRRMASLLGLGGYLDAFSSSWVRGVLVLLGFEEVRRGKSNKAIVIDMRKPIMNEVKNAKSINEVVEIIKRHLGE